MGVGLMLRGSRPKTKPGEWLAAVQPWARATCESTLVDIWRGKDRAGNPELYANLHPVSEPLEVTELPGSGVRVTAKTNTTGPGYHIYVCEVLRRMSSDLGVKWDDPTEDYFDETGYFVRSDAAAVETEMLRWLQGVARVILERQAAAGYGRFAISHALDEPTYQHGGLVSTPLGPRSREWLERVAADPAQGKDIFPWWESGLGAGYRLGIALSLMWTRVRWRSPLTDDETALADWILSLLRSAYDIDPARQYPWREWLELASYAGKEDMVPGDARRRAEQPGSRPRIGYRRRPVSVRLAAGWSIQVPGEFAEEWSDDGTYVGFDDSRNVRCTIISLGEPRDVPALSTAELVDGMIPSGPDVLEHREGEVVARARFEPDEDGDLALNGLTVAGESLVSSWFTLGGDSNREWAETSWRSIRPHGEPRASG